LDESLNRNYLDFQKRINKANTDFAGEPEFLARALKKIEMAMSADK
jgi:hypothetical protein